MQTFLPLPDFRASLETLDRGRLGKQRLETLQLVEVVIGGRVSPRTDGGFDVVPYVEDDYRRFVRARRNHPACRMWDGHLEALATYGATSCLVWRERGYNDTTHGKLAFVAANRQLCANDIAFYPPWFGDDAFHYAHRANLVRKDPDRFSPLFPDVDIIAAPHWPYVWPRSPYHPTQEHVNDGL